MRMKKMKEKEEDSDEYEEDEVEEEVVSLEENSISWKKSRRTIRITDGCEVQCLIREDVRMNVGERCS